MMMTRLLPVTALLAALLPAQSPNQEALIQQRTDKLAKEVFKKAPWLTDYDAARAQAKKEHKLIFTYFTRSYAR